MWSKEILLVVQQRLEEIVELKLYCHFAVKFLMLKGS